MAFKIYRNVDSTGWGTVV